MLVLAILLLFPADVNADPFFKSLKKTDKSKATLEVYSGANVTENGFFGYGGVAWAPLGEIEKQGLRIKLLGGGGKYKYNASVLSSGNFDTTYPVIGQTELIDILLGYAIVADPLYVKLYGGVSQEIHRLSVIDERNAVQGNKINGKAQIELWLNLGQDAWLSADGSYGWAFGSYNATLKLGYQLTKSLSIGTEFGALGNNQFDGARYGGFVRHKSDWLGELTIAAGASGDYEDPAAAYGRISYSNKF